MLKNLPKITMKDEICTITSLNLVINLHKSKAKDKPLKTKNTWKRLLRMMKWKLKMKKKKKKKKKSHLSTRGKAKARRPGQRKEEKKPRDKESKDPLPLVVITLPTAQTTKATILPSPSKTPKTTTTTNLRTPSFSSQIQTSNSPKIQNVKPFLSNPNYYYFPAARRKSSISCHKLA